MAETSKAVILDGVSLPLMNGMLTRRNIDQFPLKTANQGAIRAEDHTIRSVWSVHDLSGGFGRRRYFQQEEGTNRFYFSTLDTRWPGFLTLPPDMLKQPLGATPGGVFVGYNPAVGSSRVPIVTASATMITASGNVNGSGNTVFAAGSTSFAFGATITGTCRWRGNTIVAIGGANKSYFGVPTPNFDLASHTQYTDANAFFQCVAALDNLVYGFKSVTGGYEVYASSNATLAGGGATWTLLSTINLFDYNETMLDVVAGYSGDGLPCLYGLTPRRVFQYDPSYQRANEVYRFTSSAVGYQSIVAWDKTRGIYVTNGSDVIEILPGDIRHIGPYKDDGLPIGSSAVDFGIGGVMTGLFSMENWLGVICNAVGGNGSGPTYSAALLYDTIGWHMLGYDTGIIGTNGTWVDAVACENAVYIPVSAPVNSVMCWYAPDLQRPPWQIEPNYRYRTTGALITPWFDNDMPDLDKLADQIEVQGFGFSATNVCTIQYQVDYDTGTWTTLGSTPTTGTFTEGSTHMDFGPNVGVAFRKIRLRISLVAGSTASAPVVENVALKYVVRPQTLYGWEAHIDCRTAHNGLTPQQLGAYARSLMQKKTKVHLEYDDLDTYVLVSGFSGEEAPDALEENGTYMVTLLEPRSSVS